MTLSRDRLGALAFWLLASVLVLALGLLFLGCTTIGLDLTPPRHAATVPLRLCALLDEGVTWTDAQALIDATRFDRYGVALTLVGVQPWPRPGFTVFAIEEALLNASRPAGCDVLVGFIGRHAGDVLWGLLLPEVLGSAVFGGDRAYVVAQWASINQVLWRSPATVLEHELLHVLGCDHGVTMGPCHRAIAQRRGRP